MCMCEVMYPVLCSAMQAPSQGNNVRGLQVITSVADVFGLILRCLSWQDLAHNLFPNKRTLGQVMVYLGKFSDFTNGSYSPNLSYNYDVWTKVYPLYILAQISGLRPLTELCTECHLFYVYDELLSRSLQPFRHCREVSLQTPTTLEDHGFTTLFEELSLWPQLRSIHFSFGTPSSLDSISH